jgi:hypothetical protein
MPDTATGPVIPMLDAEIITSGNPVAPAADADGAVGRTAFDAPGSSDLTVTVLLGRDALDKLPSQSLVRIASRDGREYVGAVTAGPFAEPDGLPATSPLLVTASVHRTQFQPPFHGRVEVTIHGERVNGTTVPPRLRPLPNSPVFALDDAETAAELKCDGDIRLGLLVGRAEVAVGIPSARKDVLPRHTAVLGTTGGGKSNTVAGLVKRAIDAGLAVVLLDVEGEYTRLDEPADGPLAAALASRGLKPAGVPADRMTVYHLTGREPANPPAANLTPFSLQFARLSPYTACELMGANDAQEERFFAAYDLAKRLMRDLGLFPERDKPEAERQKQERFLLRLDEFERGYPRLTLSRLLDVVGLCHAAIAKVPVEPFNPEFRADAVKGAIDKNALPGNAASWGKLKSLLWRLKRLGVFDDRRDGPLNYAKLIAPGRLSVIDLSDAGLTEVANLAIADLLRGVQEAQEDAYKRFESAGTGTPPATLVVVEEAHEFLSKERIDKTAALFDMVGRIAKRGRKRRLGLCFVTQLPAHLPPQVLGLCNGFVLHKLTDPGVVSLLKKTVGGVGEGLWDRLPTLAPGQAVASFPHLGRPLLVSVDPAQAKLRLGE